jgi:signal transduction histidine kinase
MFSKSIYTKAQIAICWQATIGIRLSTKNENVAMRAGEPFALDADPVRLAQVFTNLLNNSAKYTEHGGDIWLMAERRGDEAIVVVRESGVGIPSEMLPRVIDLFAQVDRSLGRAEGGLGIGFSLGGGKRGLRLGRRFHRTLASDGGNTDGECDASDGSP